MRYQVKYMPVPRPGANGHNAMMGEKLGKKGLIKRGGKGGKKEKAPMTSKTRIWLGAMLEYI